jgi:hypothetical protein
LAYTAFQLVSELIGKAFESAVLKDVDRTRRLSEDHRDILNVETSHHTEKHDFRLRRGQRRDSRKRRFRLTRADDVKFGVALSSLDGACR